MCPNSVYIRNDSSIFHQRSWSNILKKIAIITVPKETQIVSLSLHCRSDERKISVKKCKLKINYQVCRHRHGKHLTNRTISFLSAMSCSISEILHVFPPFFSRSSRCLESIYSTSAFIFSMMVSISLSKFCPCLSIASFNCLEFLFKSFFLKRNIRYLSKLRIN